VCSLAGLDRKIYQSEKKRGGEEALRERLLALSNELRRFRYRGYGILFAQEERHPNHYRVYAEVKLAVRGRKGRKRTAGLRRRMILPKRPNEPWCLEFVSDSLSGGRQFRIFYG